MRAKTGRGLEMVWMRCASYIQKLLSSPHKYTHTAWAKPHSTSLVEIIRAQTKTSILFSPYRLIFLSPQPQIWPKFTEIWKWCIALPVCSNLWTHCHSVISHIRLTLDRDYPLSSVHYNNGIGSVITSLRLDLHYTKSYNRFCSMYQCSSIICVHQPTNTFIVQFNEDTLCYSRQYHKGGRILV